MNGEGVLALRRPSQYHRWESRGSWMTRTRTRDSHHGRRESEHVDDGRREKTPVDYVRFSNSSGGRAYSVQPSSRHAPVLVCWDPTSSSAQRRLTDRHCAAGRHHFLLLVYRSRPRRWERSRAKSLVVRKGSYGLCGLKTSPTPFLRSTGASSVSTPVRYGVPSH